MLSNKELGWRIAYGIVIGFVLLSVLKICVEFYITKREQAKVETDLSTYDNRASQNRAPQNFEPTQPFIGMGLDSFQKLCGLGHVLSVTQTSRGEFGIVEYGRTEQSEKTGCWGTFSFENNILTIIHRGPH